MFAPTPTGPALADARDLYFQCLATPETTQRASARLMVRQALRETLALLLPTDREALSLISAPGQPIRLEPPWTGVGLSVSHEPGLSLIAIHLAGPVGVDLMRVASAPADSNALARDYLGPGAAAALAKLPAEQRQCAFAQAWTRLEARLKCLALELREWTPEFEVRLAACSVAELAMPAGWVAAVAIPGDRLRNASRNA